ncbi:MAG: alpha-2-macroglobulin family protein [Putridiphycobacter sp.]
MRTSFILSLFMILGTSHFSNSQNNFEKEWSKVDSLEKKGLYNMALTEVNAIFDLASKSKNHNQVIKSVFYELKYNSYLKEDDYIIGIHRLEDLIEQAPSPSKEILHSLTAEVFWGYYNSNSWKYQNRTFVESEVKMDDIRTWDLKRIADKVIFHYTASLKNESFSQNANLNQFDDIIIRTDDTKAYRPTLYDFLVHRAIDFFATNSFNVPGPAETFTLNKKDYFSTNHKFLNLNASTKDTFNTKFYAVLGYKLLTDFHLRQQNQSAILMLELERLKFAKNMSTLSNKESLYENALTRMTTVYPKNENIAEVWYEIANLHRKRGNAYVYPDETNRWELQKAIKICEGTIEKFPESFGARQCMALSNDIMKKALSFTSEAAIIPEQKSKFLIQYKNVDKVYLKIVEYSYQKLNKLTSKKRKEILQNRKSVYEKIVNLENPKDFQSHTVEELIPELPIGHYIIVLSSTPEYTSTKEAFTYQSLWVTNLTYQTQKQGNVGKVLVTNRTTGVPVPEATVIVKYSKYNYKLRLNEEKTYGKFVTDKNGLISFTSNSYKSFYFEIEKDDDAYTASNNLYLYKSNPNRSPFVTTKFFTDRKIYRPGQTIYFKGISYTTNQKEKTINKNYETTVYFYDVNHQEVAKTKVKTNEFGSFAGQFIAPYGVLTGNMYIKCESGNTNFRVEEYKRPKFTTEIKPLEGEYKLNDSVEVEGFAKAFAGNFIDGAEVSYRITRTTRYNRWRYGWWWYPTEQEKEISFGNTITDENGVYKINFKALPDETKDPKNLPIFDYKIYVDVTDINGETHSTLASVSVGYQSLQLSNNIPSEFSNQKNLDFKIFTTNLNGQKIDASGKLNIYPLVTPNRTFKSRLWQNPDMKNWSKDDFYNAFPLDVYENENDYHTWEKQKPIFNSKFNTSIQDSIHLKTHKWPTGYYAYEAIAYDKNGIEIKDVKYFQVFNDGSTKPSGNEVFKTKLLTNSVQPGEKVKVLISTAEKHINVFYSIENKGKTESQNWIKLSNEQKIIEVDAKEIHRGNFSINFSVVKNNRSYEKSHLVHVPYENKQLDLTFSTFRNKLLPGQDEEWTLNIKNKKGEAEMAELLAALYDASLDELYTPNNFFLNIYNTYYGTNSWSTHMGIRSIYANNHNYQWNDYVPYPNRYMPKFNYFGYRTYYYGGYYRSYANYDSDGFAEGEVMLDEVSEETVLETPMVSVTDKKEKGSGKFKTKSAIGGAQKEDQQNDLVNAPLEQDREDNSANAPGGAKLNEVKARTNFNETAFFYPQLLADKDGNVQIKFTIPESLTKWRFLGLAHTQDLKYGTISEEVVTQKDLMVVPNTPRFLREGDKITLSTKISNISKKDLDGQVRLTLIDPYTEKEINTKFELTNETQNFSAKAGQSTQASWTINVPYNLSAVKYKFVAVAGNFSDGEENALPILTNRMLVTESLPMPIRGKESKTFNFVKLQNSGKSQTLKHHRYTLEFTSNPAWYALQAMPYMMEYPYECAEQTFTRYYSNAIASHIMNGNPKIKQVIEDWGKNSPEAFLSNLQKNQELKELLLEETPWVLDAKSEEQSKKNLSILLDMNRMSKELDKALSKTIKNQSVNGGWPWFPGMKESRYITQHIITGMGHLDHLGIKDVRENRKTWNMVKKGVNYLDGEIVKDFRAAKKWDKDYLKNQHIGYSQIQYLYSRSYFPNINMNKATKEAVGYYMDQAKTYWLKFNIYAEGMIALGAHRMGETDLANDIVKSLKDRAINSDEFGMYWKDFHVGYYWYQAPIETQALMIEMFDEVANDQKSVEELKIWLLKQKQTTNWKTTKQTSEAIYALLLKGTDLLANDDLVEITLGGKPIKYVNQASTNPYEVQTQAGTGYFKTNWNDDEVKPEMGKIEVTKNSTGVAWGAAYWQYFEDLDKITTHETPLKLDKQLYLVKHSSSGEVLTQIKEGNELKIGDKVRVRIELFTDRNLEYVHMKDMRASGFEPLNVLSRYKWREGLGYYEATKDAATNFFFDYIPKGSYVFEYDLRVQHKGDFSNGITTIQCMYAPEFTSHSEGIRVKVVD